MPNLQNATALYVGDTPVTRVYLGEQQVWPHETGPLVSEMRQQQTGTWAGEGFTVTLPSAPAPTSTLVLIVAGNITFSPPPGWTLRESQVHHMGHYLFTCTGTTATSWSVTTANSAGTWWVAEVTHASYDMAAGIFSPVEITTYETPALQPTAGSRMLIASIGSVLNSGPRTISGWTNDFVEVADICQPSWDYPMQGVATRTVEASGTTSYSTAGTFSVQGSPSAIICSLIISTDSNVPMVAGVTPAAGAIDIATTTAPTVSFGRDMAAGTITASSVVLRDGDGATVPATVTYNPVSRIATITPAAVLQGSTHYTVTLSTDIEDEEGGTLAAPYSWSFTTVAVATGAVSPLAMGHGGPVLLVTKQGQAFSEYYSEILRAEGLNSFDTIEVDEMDQTVLDSHDVVLLGEMSLTAGEVATLSDWVDAGGRLVAMRPDAQLASLLGVTSMGGTLDDAYVKIDTSTTPGAGLESQTMQYHGAADRYTALGGTMQAAMLCSDATTETTHPAVTLRNVGGNGGVAVAFAYDLARSVALTHQGNPAWAAQDRNDDGIMRSNDLFHGAMTGDNQPDYLDLDRVAIPQADEQQRLLANILNEINRDNQPLPKFSYLPYNDKVVVVLVCDDHATLGAESALSHMMAESPVGGSVDDWECVRATSLMYTITPLDNSRVAYYAAQGFDFGVHMSTGNSWTPASLATSFDSDFADFQAKYPSIPPQRINRNHSIVWCDYATMAKQEAARGIRLDLNYYYWPGSWVQDRPGFMNGSGMVMRFADTDGTMIDTYQLASHLVNESGQTWPHNIDVMLERALGAEGYYGILGTHYDYSDPFDRQLIASAKAHGVRLVSGEQILRWTDGRNASYFTPGSWSGNVYSFSATVDSELRQMGRILLPMQGRHGVITGITRGGVAQAYTVEVMKGVSYAVVTAANGTYEVTYGTDTTPPAVVAIVPASGAAEVSPAADIRLAMSEPLDPATVTSATVQLLAGGTPVAATVSYEMHTNTIRVVPASSLAANTTYTVSLSTGVQDAHGVALATTYTSSFTTTSGGLSIWAPAPQTVNNVTDGDGSVELGLQFRSSQIGEVVQIKFYKNPNDTLSTHTVRLWSPDGNIVATATTSSETASGWQAATLDTPVAIAANTTYTASYLASAGFYCHTAGGLSSAVTNGPLTALANGGRYAYPSGHPTGMFGSANYWIDVGVNIL